MANPARIVIDGDTSLYRAEVARSVADTAVGMAEIERAVRQHSAGAARAAEASARAQAQAMRDAIASAQSSAAAAGATAPTASASGAAQVSQLAAVEAAARASTAATKSAGVSAVQTQAALRTLPAQIGDVVSSLASGMPVMTVFVQQGAQIKDQFGGVVPALRAVGSYVAGLVNPFSAAAAAGAVLSAAAYRGAMEHDTLSRALIMSGNAAGVTASQLSAMAVEAAAMADSTRGATSGVLAQLAETGRVGSQQLAAVTAATVAYADATGVAVDDVVKSFAELGKDPVAAAVKLNESQHWLTLAVYEQIAALGEQGRVADAAAVAQSAYAAELRRRAEQIDADLGYLQRAWRGLGDAASWAWDKMLNIGRNTLADQIAAAKARVDEMTLAVQRSGGAWRQRNQEWLADEQAELARLQGLASIDAERAKAIGDGAAQVEARTKWDKEADKYLDKRVKLERDITQAMRDGVAAGVAQEEIGKRILAITQAAAGPEKSGGGRATAAPKRSTAEVEQERALAAYEQLVRGIRERIAASDAEAAAIDKLTPAQAAAAKVQADMAAGYLVLTDEQRANVQALLDQSIASESAAQAEARRRAEVEAAARSDQAAREAIGAAQQRVEDLVASRKAEVQALTMTQDQLRWVNAARDLERAGIDSSTAAYDDYLYALAEADRIKAAADENQKFWQGLDQAANGVFVNVLQGSQDTMSRIRNTLKTGLLQALYDLTVKKWIIQIESSFTQTIAGGGSNALASFLTNLVMAGLTGGGGEGATTPSAWTGGPSTDLGSYVGAGASLKASAASAMATPSAAKAGAQSAASLVYAPVYQIDSRTDKAEIKRMLADQDRRTQSDIYESMRRGGRFAGAVRRVE